MKTCQKCNRVLPLFSENPLCPFCRDKEDKAKPKLKPYVPKSNKSAIEIRRLNILSDKLLVDPMGKEEYDVYIGTKELQCPSGIWLADKDNLTMMKEYDVYIKSNAKLKQYAKTLKNKKIGCFENRKHLVKVLIKYSKL